MQDLFDLDLCLCMLCRLGIYFSRLAAPIPWHYYLPLPSVRKYQDLVHQAESYIDDIIEKRQAETKEESRRRGASSRCLVFPLFEKFYVSLEVDYAHFSYISPFGFPLMSFFTELSSFFLTCMLCHVFSVFHLFKNISLFL